MSRDLTFALILLVSAPALAACGFQPVYGGGHVAGSSDLSVEQIPGRTGHMLRRALMRQTAAGLPRVAGDARLVVDLDENIKRLAFRPDGAAARSSVVLRGKYVLELPDGALTGDANAEAFFNVPAAPFSDIAAQANAAERAAEELARRINDDLRLQLDPER